MARELITLAPEMEINHAMNLLLDNRLSGAPVVDETGALLFCLGYTAMSDLTSAVYKFASACAG